MYLFYILFSYIIRIVKQIVNHLSIPNKAKQPLILINNLPLKYKKKLLSLAVSLKNITQIRKNKLFQSRKVKEPFAVCMSTYKNPIGKVFYLRYLLNGVFIYLLIFQIFKCFFDFIHKPFLLGLGLGFSLCLRRIFLI